MKRKSRIFAVGITLLGTLAASAQTQHEVSVYAGGGLSTLQYKFIEGNSKLGFGGNGGFGYSYFFNSHWGIGTGVGASLFSSKYSIPSLPEHYGITLASSSHTESYDFRYVLEGYSETQKAVLLDIPLLLRYQTGKVYAAAGVKVGIPISATFSNEADRLRTSVLGEAQQLRYTEPELGLGNFSNLSNSGDLSFKPAVFASAEVGMKWKLNEQLSLYTGVYLDYGLNNIQQEETTFQPLVDYNTATLSGSKPAVFHPNSILTANGSETAVSATRKPFVDKVSPVAAGIRLTLAFGWGKFPHKVIIHTVDSRTSDFLNAEVNIVAGNKEVFKGKTVDGIVSTKLKEGDYKAVAGGVPDYFGGEKSFTLTEEQTVVVQLPKMPPPPPPLLSVRLIEHSSQTAVNGEVLILSGSSEAYKANTVAGLVSKELKKGDYTVKTAVAGYLPLEQSFTHSAIDTAVLALHRPTLSVRLIDNADQATIEGEVSILSGTTEAYKANTVAGLVSSEIKPAQYTVKSTAEGYIYAEQSFNHITNDTLTLSLQKIKKNIVIVLNNLFFEFNKADILPESETTLRDLLKLMEENSNLKIHIVGHTDNVGTAKYNITLSKNRAAAVVKWLTDHQIAATRLTSEGKGFSVPVDSNDTEEGRAKNRRVEFVVK